MNHTSDINPYNSKNDISPSEEPPTVLLQPQYHIIGDVYVDILCYIPSCTNNSNQNCPTTTNNTMSVLKLDGTDTVLTQPITIMAGGSTLNTATYLQYLQSIRSISPSSSSLPSLSSSLDITVHTVFNSNDYYGSILMQHSEANQITLKNGFRDDCSTGPSRMTTTTSAHKQSPLRKHPKELSTPHCMVMISSSSSTATPTHPSKQFPEDSAATTTTSTVLSERTFLTHRGCATNNMCINELFPTLSPSSPIDNDNYVNGHCSVLKPRHYHIAGYYCTPEFWKTNTDTENSAILSFVKNIFTVPTIVSNENGWRRSNHSSTFADTVPTRTCSPIILSLVTQYDASQKWDITNLRSILPYMHVCIMNELEAQQIYYTNCHETVDTTGQPRDNVDSILLRMISFFSEFNTSTIYVITQGAKGAMAFRHKRIIAQVCGTVNVTSIRTTENDSDVIIDPTGAGDAFCAGFFHSLWQSIECTSMPVEMDLCKSRDSLYRPSDQYWSNAAAIQDALLFGCTIGTCSILQMGGSTIPSSDPNLVQVVHDQYKKLCSPKLNGTSLHH